MAPVVVYEENPAWSHREVLPGTTETGKKGFPKVRGGMGERGSLQEARAARSSRTFLHQLRER